MSLNTYESFLFGDLPIEQDQSKPSFILWINFYDKEIDTKKRFYLCFRFISGFHRLKMIKYRFNAYYNIEI